MTHFPGDSPSPLAALRAGTPLFWPNPHYRKAGLESSCAPDRAAIEAAAARLARFAPVLARLIPDLAPHHGVIESPLLPADGLLLHGLPGSGRAFLKADSDLAIAGSVKARGGVHEVLEIAESLLARHNLPPPDTDPDGFLRTAPAALSRYTIAVGSTGNLGLSIGRMSRALGFRAVVHMSRDARAWKKELLRREGAEVVEHSGDYASAVAAARAGAQSDPAVFFVDDEKSLSLFLGYSVAALRIQQQLAAAGVTVDAAHPLLVYLPCGVGGAPGGIAFGLNAIFGSAVHCFFAEPVQSPCMLAALIRPDLPPPQVYDLGLSNRTEADGLAVARASDLVVQLAGHLIAGVFTVTDPTLLAGVRQAWQHLGLKIEPSAAAGFPGPQWLADSPEGQSWRREWLAPGALAGATHLAWVTGGSLVPAEIHAAWLAGAP